MTRRHAAPASLLSTRGGGADMPGVVGLRWFWSDGMRIDCLSRQESDSEDSVNGSRNAAISTLLSFAMLLVSLDQYIVVVTLPEIGRHLGYSAQMLQSVVSG
jgi:hypothetical protein